MMNDLPDDIERLRNRLEALEQRVDALPRLQTAHEEDREEVIDLNQAIETAINNLDASALKQAIHDLRELLFFVEGQA